MGKGSVVSAVLVALVGVAVLGYFGMMIFDTDGDNQIEYELDGGTLSGTYPTSYHDGEYVQLPIPSKVDSYFMGWFGDSKCTEPLGAITETMRGNVKAYALWSTVDPVGGEFDLGTYMGQPVTVGITGYEDATGCTYNIAWPGDAVAFDMADEDVVFMGSETKAGYLCSKWAVDGMYIWIYCGVPIAVSDGSSLVVDPDPGYNIDYQLDGGVLPSNARTGYMWGGYLDLPVPTKAGSYFAGWYLDPVFNEPIGAITSDVSGPLTLYAQWYGNNPVGIEVSYGGIDYAVYGFEEGSTFAVISQEGKADVGLWTYGDDVTYTGNQTISGDECAVWSIGAYTLYYDSVMPKAIAYGGTTYDMTSSQAFELPDIMVSFDADSGVAISSGTVGFGKAVTFSSTKTVDWLVDSVKASSSTTYTIDMLMPGITYRAATDTVKLISSDSTSSDLGLGDVVRVFDSEVQLVFDSSTGTDVSMGLEPGAYVAIAGSSAPYTSLSLQVGKTVVFDWSYGGDDYSLTLNMDPSYVEAYLEECDEYSRLFTYYETWSDEVRAQAFDEFVNGFITTDDKYVVEVAEYLESQRGTMDDVQFASFVLHFVGEIDYVSDPVYDHPDFDDPISEYYKFPVEMLFDYGGDCEDAVILYTTLMSLLGYDTGMITLPGHAMAILDIGEYNENGFAHEGVWYTYCETTNPFDVGELGYNSATHSPASVDPNDIGYIVLIPKVEAAP